MRIELFLILTLMSASFVSAGYIGEGGIDWNFELIQEDYYLNTSVIIINSTLLELNVTKIREPHGNYKWHMAVCNISGLDELYQQFEDSQGGFNYSYPIEVNYGNLTNYGLPEHWCNITGGYGYVLFANINKNKLPFRLRLIIEEDYPTIFRLYTGSNSIIIDAEAVSGATSYAPNENLFRDSTGEIHVGYISSGGDLWYGNSTDSGITWSTKEVSGFFLNFGNVGINGDSDDNLYLYYEPRSLSPQPIRGRNSTNNGVSWGAVYYLFTYIPDVFPALGGSIYRPSCITGSDDEIHCCAIGHNSTGDYLLYNNKSGFVSSGSAGQIYVHNQPTDDTDFCDIAVDSNNNVCISAIGTDQADLDVFCTTDNWTRHHVDDLTSFLSILGAHNSPTISCDNEDMFHILYDDPTGSVTPPFGSTFYLKHANFTANNLSDFDITTIDTQSSHFMDNGISSQRELVSLYSQGINLGNMVGSYIYRANASDGWSNWDSRVFVQNNSNSPSIQDSKYPISNRMTDTLRYVFVNASNDLLFDNESLKYPTCYPEPNSNWDVNLEDMCSNYVVRDIRPYNFSTYGDSGWFKTYASIFTDEVFLDVHGGDVYCNGGFFNVI